MSYVSSTQFTNVEARAQRGNGWPEFTQMLMDTFRIWTEHIAAQLLVLLNSCPLLPPWRSLMGKLMAPFQSHMHYTLFLHASAHYSMQRNGARWERYPGRYVPSHGLPAEEVESELGSERWRAWVPGGSCPPSCSGNRKCNWTLELMCLSQSLFTLDSALSQELLSVWQRRRHLISTWEVMGWADGGCFLLFLDRNTNVSENGVEA